MLFRNKKRTFVYQDKGAFFEWCLPVTQMMKAKANDDANASDVCLRAHKGKHRIIVSETSNIILSEAKNIISP